MEEFDKYLQHILDRKEAEFECGKLKRESFLLRQIRETYKYDKRIPILHPRDALLDIRDLVRKGYLSEETLENFGRANPIVGWAAYKCLLKNLNKRGIRTSRQKFQRKMIILYILLFLLFVVIFLWYFYF